MKLMSEAYDFEKQWLRKLNNAIDSSAGEDILQMPVEVEVIESLFAGGDVCRIAIYIPDQYVCRLQHL
ncbi:MAG: hypothetical protein KAW14_03795 [Candidatus Aegiribacteria sp.]|nr:hypothetical protein [Candidatus Aegiribacteria sp.]